MKPEINVGMRIDAKGREFEVTADYDGEIELDGEHFVSREKLIRDIQTGRTEVISE
mgnify:CR=1 FL=1